MTIKPRVEPSPFSRRALAAEEPLEGGDGRASGQRSGQHAPPKVATGRIAPDERYCRAEQPEWAVATVSDDECRQAKEARLTRDGKARRRLLIEGDELLQRVLAYEALVVRASSSARAISNWNGLSTSIPISA